MASPNTREEATEQMFAAVGRAITQWGFVEEQLFRLFAVCAGNVLPYEEGRGIQFIDSWIPMWIFYSLDTFHGKRTILDAAMKAYLYAIPQEEELLSEWGKLSQKGRELATKRNKLAHWTVLPAQPLGSGTPEEGFGPARLMPTIGSPNYWRETGIRPPRKSLTQVQVGHIEMAFHLYSEKLRCFVRKITDTPELRDRDVELALRLLLMDGRLSQTVRAELAQLLASLR